MTKQTTDNKKRGRPQRQTRERSPCQHGATVDQRRETAQVVRAAYVADTAEREWVRADNLAVPDNTEVAGRVAYAARCMKIVGGRTRHGDPLPCPLQRAQTTTTSGLAALVATERPRLYMAGVLGTADVAGLLDDRGEIDWDPSVVVSPLKRRGGTLGRLKRHRHRRATAEAWAKLDRQAESGVTDTDREAAVGWVKPLRTVAVIPHPCIDRPPVPVMEPGECPTADRETCVWSPNLGHEWCRSERPVDARFDWGEQVALPPLE